jgi:two-component system, chemotaxis family, chemotaxis protein CheY
VSEPTVRILLVGHCGPDSYALRSAVESMVPGAIVEFAPDGDSLRRGLATASLLLINRVLDGDYSSATGLELILDLHRSAPGVPTMLVSNFAEAQEQAIAAGARPGFGKREMYAEETRAKIRDAIGLK